MSRKPATQETIHHWLATVPPNFESDCTLNPASLRPEGHWVPTQDPRVQLEDIIGQGGMATVHGGRQISLDRNVAIKVRRVELEANNADILHEALLTSALEHPNIVPIYDLALDPDGDPMVLMRRIAGIEWGKLFGKPDLVLRDFGASDAMDWHLRVLLQVCNAVHYAHSMGVIHRDIKPDNVMVGDHGQVYLLDWGIAVCKRGSLAAKLHALRAHAEPAGTPCYLAPEMMSGELEEVDERTDVYLLGATLFHLVTGRPPHRGKTLEEVLEHVVNKPVDIPESLPIELQGILARSLAQEPTERFASVADLRRAIDEYLSHRSSHQLEVHAQQHLASLRQALQARTLNNPEDRIELYRLYSSCRSEYRAALQLWSDNPAAKRGLHSAISDMIEAEIEHGTPRAATALLSEFEDPPEELVLKVSDAQHSEGLAHDNMEHMARIARSWSTQDGARLRVAMFLLLGICYGFYAAVSKNHNYGTSLVSQCVGLVGLGMYVILMRKRQAMSTFNMRAIFTFALVLAIQSYRRILAMVDDTPPEVILTHDGLLFVSAVAVSMATLELRLWPALVVYSVVYALVLLRLADPGLCYGVGHVFLALNSAWIWWPRASKRESGSGVAPT